MLIGIDVGGTYTDGALIADGRIAYTVKVPTRPDELLASLLGVLDEVLYHANPSRIRRIVFSTTLVTNLLAQEQLEPVGLLLLPGPGVNPELYGFRPPLRYLPGAIDYRGREIVGLDEDAALKALRELAEAGIAKVAVVGKFSPRNPAHELAVARLAAQHLPELEVEVGHKAAGRLNFPRRAATTRLTLAVRSRHQSFLDQVSRALQERKLEAPAFLLKADGGALPLEMARSRPLESVFSGPAASALGGLALTGPGEDAVVLDIGGTTTDLALILDGHPLLASKGIRIEDYYTQVRSLAVRSVPLGGDSAVRIREGRLQIGPERFGPACCLGGPAPTLTDAMRCLGLTDLGDGGRARAAMAELAKSTGVSPEQVAGQVLEEAVTGLQAAVEEMFRSWEEEPAYRIWEIVRGRKGRPNKVVGLGAAAPALVPQLAQEMGCRALVPQHAASANAIGAALARPTVYITLHADTERGFYSVEETGVYSKLPQTDRLSLEDACSLAREHLDSEAARMGVNEGEPEVLYAEGFNLVRGWHTTGRIYSVVMQLAPGLVQELAEE
ncbi:MAG: hydantoinase/oxoprolinase family protein [Clostridia bacterium]|jgi:N-methylhydantoinase A/oxoprolinase/acetone carboxylase beta subunit|nr:hydantoinase/oxoprolinase family protein [Clostridia bacterium]MDH7572156.1 hydantoinase/oxoprolinase family protein [Clostridia bacterium]